MADEINAVAQQPEPTAPTEPKPEPTAPAEPKPEPTAPAEPKPEPAAPTEPKPEPAAPAEPKAEKQDGSAAEISELKGKVHALSVGARSDTLSDLLTLANANVSENKTLDQAIDEILEKYPMFKGTEPRTITTSIGTKNDAPTEQSDAYINRIMGIK